MRRDAKVDGNQPEIVNGLRKFGASVKSVAALKEFCDIVVGYQGRNYLFEIKDPAQPPSKRNLTEAEEKFHANWLGQVDTIETLEEAISIIRGKS